MTDLLDNPVWSALAGPHAGLATGGTQARHYPRDMAPFSAIANATAAAYAELAHDLAPGIEARLFRLQPETPPPGWEVVSVRPILQMTASEEAILGEEAGIDVVTLGADDVPEMRELAEITKPGPFGERTSQLGTYIGIRHAGRLVAMAGERMKLPGHAEISAVCTHPDARGRGFAGTLTRHLARLIRIRGERPFLHVFPDNRHALALYEKLGFRTRAQLFVLWHRPGRTAPLSGAGSARLPARG